MSLYVSKVLMNISVFFEGLVLALKWSVCHIIPQKFRWFIIPVFCLKSLTNLIYNTTLRDDHQNYCFRFSFMVTENDKFQILHLERGPGYEWSLQCQRIGTLHDLDGLFRYLICLVLIEKIVFSRYMKYEKYPFFGPAEDKAKHVIARSKSYFFLLKT